MMRTNMSAGHGGASGRYKRLEERAFQFAFLLGLQDGTLGSGPQNSLAIELPQ